MTRIDKDKVAISVQGVCKGFLLPHQRTTTLKTTIIKPFSRKKKWNEDKLVLKDISFDIHKGEFLGVVGRNGSGKSTLLKIMAGVYTADKGRVDINGSLAPFIELGVGFNPELSGRDNIFLNASLLGFNRDEIEAIYEDILDFSELEEYIDQKLKNYSSGMQVRLAFSIAIQANSEILLLDEVLAVGDEAFRRKCIDYFESVKQSGKTVVLVTHDMTAVRQYCDRAIMIENGKIVKQGKPDIVAEEYSRSNLDSSKESIDKTNKKTKKLANKISDGTADILDVWTTDISGKKKNLFYPNEDILAHVKVKAKKDIESSSFGLVFVGADGKNIFATNSLVEKTRIGQLKKGKSMTITVSVNNIFNDGSYRISSSITSFNRSDIYCRVTNFHKFETGGWELKTGLAHPYNTISVRK
ncbi:ABC transporter ATP-binding protein [Candidatus Saccharibacteria bacterium]|nr:ABC transporter ATP-binding protein [Candidatus Saccharibacteria bacterium]